MIDDLGLQPQLFGPDLDLLVEADFAQDLADLLALVVQRRQLDALQSRSRPQHPVVVVADVLGVDEDPRRQPFLDVDQDPQLPRQDVPQPGFGQTELGQPGLEGLVIREPRTDLFEPAIDLLEWQRAELVALDLVEAQPLVDEPVEHPALELSGGLCGRGLHQSEADDALDVGKKDRILVDYRDDTVDENHGFRAGLGGGGPGPPGQQQGQQRECRSAKPLHGTDVSRLCRLAAGGLLASSGEKTMPGKIFIVSSPIGNLEDLSVRAKRVLAEADLVACEDTRRSGRLLAHLGLDKKLVSMHEHNEAQRLPFLVEALEKGMTVAVLSDAGTPLLSDPGFLLVREAAARDIPIEPIPGPSAVLAALVASALPPYPFTFAGFPPRSSKRRRRFFRKFSDLGHTVIFFESPHRLFASLKDVIAELGDRPSAVCRELTKLHEEVLRGTLSDILAELTGRPALKGEFVIVVGRAA